MTVGDLKKFLSDNPELSDTMDLCIIKERTDFDIGSVESIYVKKVRFSEDPESYSGDGSLECWDNVLVLNDEYMTPKEIEELKAEAEKLTE